MVYDRCSIFLEEMASGKCAYDFVDVQTNVS